LPEAIAHAENLGVIANYTESLVAAEFASELLVQLRERALTLPSSVIIVASFLAGMAERPHLP
jgi:hypothetical protein